jgi:hypothetical protein
MSDLFSCTAKLDEPRVLYVCCTASRELQGMTEWSIPRIPSSRPSVTSSSCRLPSRHRHPTRPPQSSLLALPIPPSTLPVFWGPAVSTSPVPSPSLRSPSQPGVFNTDRSGRTGRVRYRFNGPVRPETGRNQRNSNFKSNPSSIGCHRYTDRYDRYRSGSTENRSFKQKTELVENLTCFQI